MGRSALLKQAGQEQHTQPAVAGCCQGHRGTAKCTAGQSWFYQSWYKRTVTGLGQWESLVTTPPWGKHRPGKLLAPGHVLVSAAGASAQGASITLTHRWELRVGTLRTEPQQHQGLPRDQPVLLLPPIPNSTQVTPQATGTPRQQV